MDISELVEHYRRNRESYTSAQYNETQLRREYLDPFFTLLGWDIDNKHGHAEAYKDVVHEDAIEGVQVGVPSTVGRGLMLVEGTTEPRKWLSVTRRQRN